MESVGQRKQIGKKLHLSRKSFSILIFGNILISFGILLVTTGGSWDVTNHLLNKPETFFSPPHALLYSGVAIALIGAVMFFSSWRHLSDQKKNPFTFPLKLTLIGIAVLVGAGPFDFVWHSNFGLDGLLSPPHLTLISGMLLCSLGAMISLSRYVNQKRSQEGSSGYRFLIILFMLPVWLAGTGLFYSFSLPFSETDYFDFNPDPTFAIIFATLSFPFLIALILILSLRFSGNKFGILSIVGISFLVINGVTSIVSNTALHHTIPFYFLNVIPIVVADLIVTTYGKNKRALYVGGAILGAVFYLIYYPLPTYTYNDILLQQVVWPSLLSHIYFEMLSVAYPLVVVPSIVMGAIGAAFGNKISKKILRTETRVS